MTQTVKKKNSRFLPLYVEEYPNLQLRKNNLSVEPSPNALEAFWDIKKKWHLTNQILLLRRLSVSPVPDFPRSTSREIRRCWLTWVWQTYFWSFPEYLYKG